MNKHRIVGLALLLAILVIAMQFFLSYQGGYHYLQPSASPPIEPLRESLLTSEEAPSIQSTEILLENNFNTTPEVAPITPAWTVQVASLVSENAAQKLLSQLKSLNFDAYILTMSSENKSFYRVCAGPFTDKDLAISALGKIQESLKMTGILKQYSPEGASR